MRGRNLILAFSLIILWMGFYPVGVTLAQENYAVRIFTTDQGLPHNHIRGITQDQNGFLWIAT